MKQIFFFLALLFAGMTADAQLFLYKRLVADSTISVFKLKPEDSLWVNQTPLELLHRPYCEVYLHLYRLTDQTSGYAIHINSWEGYNRVNYFPATLKPICLRSRSGYVLVQHEVQMLNLMHERGWNLQEILAHTDSSGTQHSYLFKRATP